MSNTVITSYTDISGNITKPGKQLVVVVNKDGTVSFEKSVFQSLLDDKGGENTSVSLVHINEDGKPADASDDSSDDETVPHVNLTVNAFYDADTCESLEKGALDEYLLDSADYFLIGFRNDHCYTPLSPPDPGRTLDIPNKEHTVESIPISKKITIIENKIIPKDKKFINLNTADAQIILRRSDILKKIVESQKGNHNLIPLSNKTALHAVVENTVLKLDTEKLNPLTEKTSESSSESLQDDHDSDSDYHSRSRKTPIKPNKPKTVINKNVKNLLSKKIELKKNISNIHHSDIPPQYKHAKTYKVKSFSKTNNARHIVAKKLKKTLSPKNDGSFKVDNRPSHAINDIKSHGESEGSKDPAKVEVQKHVKPIPKKDKKPPAHMTALLNDMTSLFSTPDVIRRISTENKQPPKTPDRISTNIVLKKIDKDLPLEPPIVSSTPNKISADLSKNKSETKTYSNTSSKTIHKNMKDINQHLASKAGRDCTDTIGPLGDANITHLYQEAHSAMLPLNVAGNLGSMTGKLEPICTNTNNILMSPTLSGSNLNAPLSPGLDLLGGIHPEEEGLTEDLLMHVAQLVESSENLQEVIDKQVLGKVSDVSAKSIQASPGVNSLLSKMDNIPMHLLEKSNVSTPQPRKEPIQIVRSNGRVITLPPIEAPATRSSKRKSLLNATLDQPSPVAVSAVTKISTPSVQAPVMKQATQSHKKIIHKVTEHPTPSQRKPDGDDDDNVESDESWNSEDDPDRLWCICKQPHNNRFMICCDLCEDWFHGKCVNITKVMGQEMEEKGVEWRCPNCLKKKSVTKPNSPHKSTDNRSEAVVENETYLHLPTNANKSHAQGGNTNCIVCKKSARASSIYCSDICILKHAQESLNPMASSPANTSTKVQSGRTVPSDKTNPETRVIVYERETGKCLAGPSAPTAANLKVWLQENPTFEVVQPGTINRPTININKARTKSNMPKIQSVLKVNQDKQIILMQPPKGASGGNSTPNKNQPVAVQKPLTPKTPAPKVQTLKLPTPKSLSLKLVAPKELVTPKPPIPKLQIIKQPTVKPGLKSPPTPKTPTLQQKQPPLKSPPTPTYSQKRDDSKPRMYSTEPIRENVRKTLQEQLSLRMSETKDIKFTSDEIHKFAVDTEHELHDLFKDVGTRYKAKYRSLMFNLKDRKNLSLWKKICDHSITPKQLVRLSPEELASQELAQWRDQEVKHQLELIKKSELDLLACSKTYVLKTHKGEEVIESRTTDTTELDPNVTLEDIVSALNHVPGEEKLKDEDKAKDRESHSPSPSHHHRHHSHLSHHKHSKHKSRSHSKSSKSSHKKDHSSEINKVSSEKHESSRESKSSSHSRHRKNSKDRVKSHGESKHHERSRKSSHSEHHTSSKSKNDLKESPDRKSRKRSHSRDVSKARSSSKEPDKRRSSSSSKEGHKHRSSSKESEIKHNSKKSRIEESKDEYSQNFSEKLSSPLDDTSTHIDTDVLSKEFLDDGDIFVPQENIDIDSPPTPGTPEILENPQLLGADSDQEPSSTVDSIWSGCVSMIDVAKFNVSAFEVSGHCDYITKDLVPELEIVGRISPEIVWDYINKMKKQGNKDIMVIKLMPSNEEEKIQYNVFFGYLNSRNRLGVVRAHGGIKDFYVLPLTSHAPLPSVLLPLKGPGFEEPRPHLLLGIIVGQKKKRSSTHISSIPSKISKLKEASERSYTPPPTSSYTPPSSPRRSLPTLSSMPLPSFLPSLSNTVKSKIAASLASADDEPYSPGGSDSVSQSPPQAGSSDLQRKMEELNRKIEEQKKQIQNMAVNINSNESLDEPYSPSRPMSPETSKAPLPTLSSISLPSNLHEILASIQKQTKPPGTEDIQESYVPTAISINMTSVNSTYYRDGPANDVDMRVPFSLPPPGFSQGDMPEKSPSKLASLSEAELLSMVPDDEVLQPVFPPLPTAPPPLPQTDMSIPPPPYKKKHQLDLDQPPPPGLEDNNDD